MSDIITWKKKKEKKSVIGMVIGQTEKPNSRVQEVGRERKR